MRLGKFWTKLAPSEWILLAATLGTIASHALVPRDLSKGEGEMMLSLSGDHLGYSISRSVTAGVLLVSAFSIVLGARKRAPSRKAFSLWLAYLAWFVANYVLNAIGRDTPPEWIRVLYQPVVMAALLLTTPPSWPRLVRAAKLSLLAFVYGGIALAILAPEMAVAQRYSGLIPGMDFRLYGVDGALPLASCAVMFLVLEATEPASGKLRYVHVIAASAVLITSQSKTAWAFSLIALFVGGAAHVENRILKLPRARLVGPLQLALVALGALGYVMYATQGGSSIDLGSSEAAANLSTLTGRTWIWKASIDAFIESPWFGYGPKLWAGPEFVARYGAFSDCHNQLLQSLAGAGVMGVAGVLVYLAVMSWHSSKAASVTRAPMVLLAWIIFEGITEVPLRSDFLMESVFVMHAILVLAVRGAMSTREIAAWRGDNGCPGTPLWTTVMARRARGTRADEE